jgi:hypothetical protein
MHDIATVKYIENIIWLFPYHIPYQPGRTLNNFTCFWIVHINLNVVWSNGYFSKWHIHLTNNNFNMGILQYDTLCCKYRNCKIHREYYMALSVSHPVSTRDTNMTLIRWLKVHSTVQDFLMFKYMINIIWYGSFRITSRINPRPISSLELKLSNGEWVIISF